MSWCRIVLVLVLALSATAPASAQWFGKRPAAKTPPEQRVPELLGTLKSDLDERKRTAAAEELQYFEPTTFPGIVPALIEALEKDPNTGVRLEVVHTLGNLRPVSMPAGQALERAATQDAAIRVRLQARTTLVWYRLAGYNGIKTPDAPAPGKSNEPPLANAKQPPGWGGQKNGATTSVSEYRPLPVGPKLTPPEPQPVAPVITVNPPVSPPTNVPGPTLEPQQQTPPPPALLPQR